MADGGLGASSAAARLPLGGAAGGGPLAMAAISAAAVDYGSFSLSGKVAVVTGAGSGIGEAIARMFAKKGAAVQILDVNLASATAVAESINATTPEQAAAAFECDVTKKESVEAVFAAIEAAHHRLDVLVNNAGIGHVGTVLDTEESDMDRLYAVNVKGIYNCLKQGVAAMLRSGGGSIINMGSIASTIGLADRFAYSMSKGAVLTMSLSVATDFVRHGIRCNCVCPARVHTPFVDSYLSKHYAGHEEEKFKELSDYQPMGRMGKPEEIAAMVLYLAADESRFVTGAQFAIDGGVAAVM